MEILVSKGDGAISVSLKRKRLVHSYPETQLVGTFKPEPCVGCGCEIYKLNRDQTILYEGVTKGVGAIPKHIRLDDALKNKLREVNSRVRPFLDDLKSKRLDRWIEQCCGLVDDICRADGNYSRKNICDPQRSMPPVEIEFSNQRKVPSLDLVEHLGMSQVELINLLIENNFLPERFWDIPE